MQTKVVAGKSKSPVQEQASSLCTDSTGIRWDLNFYGEERLAKLGLKTLIQACRDRGFDSGDTVDCCVKRLLDWKTIQKRNDVGGTPSPLPSNAPPLAANVAPNLACAAGGGCSVEKKHIFSPPILPDVCSAPKKTVPVAETQKKGRKLQCPLSASSVSVEGRTEPSGLIPALPLLPKTSPAHKCDVKFLTWNIKFLTRNTDIWEKRKQNIIGTLDSLRPDFIAVQELMSGDGGPTDGGMLAAAELNAALGLHWTLRHCDTQAKGLGTKRNERILFLWRLDHPVFSGRLPVLRTLVMNLVDSGRDAAAPVAASGYTGVSLTQFIAAVTDGKLCHESDLQREKQRILGNMKSDIGYTASSTFSFSRNPALLSFAADEAAGVPALHILSFHLDTHKVENAAEIYVLQHLMILAWTHGVQLVCMGDHNADEANNAHSWQSHETVAAAAAHSTAVAFERLSQRVFPQHLFTNRFPYALKAAHNDDIFAPKSWELKGSEMGLIPASVKEEEERLAVQSGDCKTKFTSLDHLWSDHRPLAASFGFEVSAPLVALRADALPQAPTTIKKKSTKTSGSKGGGLCVEQVHTK
jgi:endonuclease/exonuclease/phosphatase family metal-dependent hydrolase